MTSLALKNAMNEPPYKDMIIAIGYYTHPQTETLVKKLKEQLHLGNKNICLDVSGMVTAFIPLKKREKIKTLFPGIKYTGEGERFFGTTHRWMGEGYKGRFDVRWHPQNVRNYGEPEP